MQSFRSSSSLRNPKAARCHAQRHARAPASSQMIRQWRRSLLTYSDISLRQVGVTAARDRASSSSSSTSDAAVEAARSTGDSSNNGTEAATNGATVVDHSSNGTGGNGAASYGITGDVTSSAQATAARSQTDILAEKLPRWRWEESDDAAKAYGIFFGVLLLGTLPAVTAWKYSDLFYFVALAATTIYIGAHKGLTTPQRQQITLREGVLAPLAASVALFGGYLLIKFFPDLSLQTFLNAYFWLLGSIAVTPALQTMFRASFPSAAAQPLFHFDVPEGLVFDENQQSVTRASLAAVDVAAVVAAVALVTTDAVTNHSVYTLNNLIACLVASDILQLLGLKSFRVAGILLLGLLAYDVFWVFGSPRVIGDNVMLTVATSDALNVPTRLLFPKLPGGVGEAANFPFSLLGLGDVAVPGLLACLALRYDASRTTDFRARAVLAADAMTASIADAADGTSRRQMAIDAATAAEAAFDEFADAEDAKRDRTTSSNGVPSSNGTSVTGGNGAASQAEQHECTISDAVLHQRTYFTPVMFAYVAGLLMAFAANAITHLGQPALLYLCPCTLGAVALTAASRRELAQLWSYTDNTPSPPSPWDMKDKKSGK